MLLAWGRAEQDTDAQVVAIEDDVNQDREGDDASPEVNEPDRVHLISPEERCRLLSRLDRPPPSADGRSPWPALRRRRSGLRVEVGVASSECEDKHVNDHVANERGEHLCARQCRRHGVSGAQ